MKLTGEHNGRWKQGHCIERSEAMVGGIAVLSWHVCRYKNRITAFIENSVRLKGGFHSPGYLGSLKLPSHNGRAGHGSPLKLVSGIGFEDIITNIRTSYKTSCQWSVKSDCLCPEMRGAVRIELTQTCENERPKQQQNIYVEGSNCSCRRVDMQQQLLLHLH